MQHCTPSVMKAIHAGSSSCEGGVAVAASRQGAHLQGGGRCQGVTGGRRCHAEVVGAHARGQQALMRISPAPHTPMQPQLR